MYVQGEIGMDEIVDEVVRIYRKSAGKIDWDISAFNDYGRIKERISGRLINTGKNEEMLKTVPHREFLDLSLVYSVDYPNKETGEVGSIKVTNEHAEMWNVDEEELFRQAKENMERHNGTVMESLEKFFKEMTGNEMPLVNGNERIPLYILTNKQKRNGAVEMMNDKALEEAFKVLGKDFMIIPSSIHEVLLLPVEEDRNYMGSLAEMVQQVNDKDLPLNEILSYHVYRYSHKTGRVAIAV
jgi:hypothetical protein